MADAVYMYPNIGAPDERGEVVYLMARVEGEVDGQPIIGDIFEPVRPGESAYGYSYEEWKAAAEDGNPLPLKEYD